MPGSLLIFLSLCLLLFSFVIIITVPWSEFHKNFMIINPSQFWSWILVLLTWKQLLFLKCLSLCLLTHYLFDNMTSCQDSELAYNCTVNTSHSCPCVHFHISTLTVIISCSPCCTNTGMGYGTFSNYRVWVLYKWRLFIIYNSSYNYKNRYMLSNLTQHVSNQTSIEKRYYIICILEHSKSIASGCIPFSVAGFHSNTFFLVLIDLVNS